MKLDKETLQKWKEDAKKAKPGNWLCDSDFDVFTDAVPPDIYGEANSVATVSFGSPNGQHIANASPKNFIALIEKLERYEEILGESFFLFEGLINTHEAYANMAATIHRELEIE